MGRKRTLLCAAGVAVLLAGTAACSGGGSASGPVTLTVYSEDAANQKTWDSLLAPWEQENNVKLKFVYNTLDKESQQLQNAVRAGEAPDLIITNGLYVRTYAQQGWLAPLDGIVNTADLIPLATDPFEVDGKLYAASVGNVTFTGTTCNETLMQKYGLDSPATFDAVKADVAKLKDTGVALFAEPGGTLPYWSIWLMQAIQQESGGKPTDVTTATLAGQMKFTDPLYVKALQDLADFGSSGALSNGVMGLSVDNAVSAILEQKAVCNYGFPSIITSKATFPVSITAFPTFGSTASTPFGGGALPVAEYAKMDPAHKAAADKFVKYVTAASFNKDYLTGVGSAMPVPVVKGVSMPYKSAAVETAVTTYQPKINVYLDWAWPKSVTAVIQQQVQGVVGGRTSAQDAAKAIQLSLDQAKADGFKY